MKSTVGISKVLAMVWVLTFLRGQIRLKLMTLLVPTCIGILKCVCCILCGCSVFPLLEYKLQGQQGLGPPFLLSPSSCCHLHAVVNKKKEKKERKVKTEVKWHMFQISPLWDGQNSDFFSKNKNPLKDLFERGKI